MRQRLLLAVVSSALVAVLMMGPGASATHEPANKTSAAGATNDVLGPGEDVILLSEKVKTSKPEDLILQVTAECSILTELRTTGTDDANAFGQVRVWVTIDGQPVPVAAGDDDGKVVFCNRAERRITTVGADDENDTSTETHQNTRQANGFNWMALDVGSDTHEIQVHAELTETAMGDEVAEAVVGNRTLIVEPTKAANDEEVTPLQ